MRNKDITSSIENHRLINFVVIAIAWIFLRVLFEGVLEGTHSIGYSRFSYRALIMYFIHFPLFYLTTYLIITIIMSWILQEDIKRTTRFASLGMGLIILVPIIDAIFHDGCFITYPERLEKFFLHFLNPFVSLIDIGVSIGQRLVIVIICLFAGIYGYITKKSILKSILLFFAILMVILFCGSITTIIAGNRPESVYTNVGILYTDTQKFSAVYAILFVIALFCYLYRFDKHNFHLLVSSLRIERMAFYGFLGLAGLLISRHQTGLFNRLVFFDFVAILLIFLTPGFGFWTAQILNDFCDKNLDANFKTRNPLTQGLDQRYYTFAGFVIAFMTLIFSAILNYQAFLIMLSFLLLGVVYSVPPVRIKRIPLLSTFLLAVVVVLSVGFGFSIVYCEKALNQIPQPLVYALLCGITLGFTAKDLNDIPADRTNGVISLPVLLYRQDSLMGRLPMALIIGTGYVFFGIFLPEILLISVLFAMTTFLYTLFARKPAEWFYFLLLYIFSCRVLLLVIFNLKS